MATNSYGLSSVIFGTPTLSGYVLQTISIDSKNGINTEIFNELGQRVGVRYSDLTTEVSLDTIFNGATLPIPGAELSVIHPITSASTKYEVLTLAVKGGNKEFVKATIKCKTSENLTLP